MNNIELLNNYITVLEDNEANDFIKSLSLDEIKKFNSSLGLYVAKYLGFMGNIRGKSNFLQDEINEFNHFKNGDETENEIKVSILDYLNSKNEELSLIIEFINFRKKMMKDDNYLNDNNYIKKRDEFLSDIILIRAGMVCLKYNLIHLSSKSKYDLNKFNFSDFGIFIEGNLRNTKKDITESVDYFNDLRDKIEKWANMKAIKDFGGNQKEVMVLEILSPEFISEKFGRNIGE